MNLPYVKDGPSCFKSMAAGLFLASLKSLRSTWKGVEISISGIYHIKFKTLQKIES